MKMNRIIRQLIILWMIFIMICSVNVTDCNNYYNETNLPIQCNNSTYVCAFSSITNSSLLQNNSLVGTPYAVCIDLSNYQVDFGQQVTNIDNLQFSIYVNALSMNLINYTIFAVDIILLSNVSITLNNASLSAEFIWISSNSVYLSYSNITKQATIKTQCNCMHKGSNCTLQPYYLPFLYQSTYYPSNFSMNLMNYTYQNLSILNGMSNSAVIVANQNINLDFSIIRISFIGLYSQSILLQNSTLNTTGLGYPSGAGVGCGYFNLQLNQLIGCTGTGGSHGGFGGNSGPSNCQLLISNPPYGREFIPRYPGSGGGFFLKQIAQISAGGGVINIQVGDLLLNQSYIQANGIRGIQGGGGGAGGAIAIDYTYMLAYSNNLISANGGDGKSSGGGGRIRFWNQNWSNKIYFAPNQSNILVQTLRGSGCIQHLSCGQNGSITASPCPSGMSLNIKTFRCEMCQIGFYQLSYGYGNCTPCLNKPQNSNYQLVDDPSLLSNYTAVCQFYCSSSCITDIMIVSKYKNKECLNGFDFALAGIGGTNLLISFSIILFTIIVVSIITLIRKLSYRDSNLYDGSQIIDYYKKKSYFKIQDIPYHEFRIYFQGDNTPNSPWKIGSNINKHIKEFCRQIKFFKQDSSILKDSKIDESLLESKINKPLIENKQILLQNDYNSSLQQFVQLFEEINAISQYSSLLKWLLIFLKFVYYPMSLFLAESLKLRKAKLIRKIIIQKIKRLQANMAIKFHVDLSNTVGSLQIFNNNKQSLDYYIKNYFPMYFKLKKEPHGGFFLDFTDPLLKAFFTYFQDKNDKKLQDYFMQLNYMLRNCDLEVYRHLWKIRQFSPILQCYLWQPFTKELIQKSNSSSSSQSDNNGVLGIKNNFEIDLDQDLFLFFSIQQKNEGLINLTSTNISYSSHFYYSFNLPNIYFDQISCIRYKYNLRHLNEIEQKKPFVWQIQNNYNEKYLSWALGINIIIMSLLYLFAFLIIIVILVQEKGQAYLFCFLIFFILFPGSELFMIAKEFNMILSKVGRGVSSIGFFNLFSIIKIGICGIVLMSIIVDLNESNRTTLTLQIIWVFLLIFQILALIIFSLLNYRFHQLK